MAFGGEIDHGGRLVLRKQPADELPITDVPLDEYVPGIASQATTTDMFPR